MRYTPQEHTLCVNTAMIDKHLNEQDNRDKAFDYVYKKIVYMLREELEECQCQEDIHEDLRFEVQYIIDHDSIDADADEVVSRIYSDFDIKGA